MNLLTQLIEFNAALLVISVFPALLMFPSWRKLYQPSDLLARNG